MGRNIFLILYQIKKVKPLNDIKLEEKFDYITLIGVLEYAGMFTHTNNPTVDFLKNIKRYLKDDGTIILAIENKFGLKYWSGVRFAP
jgi:cyclopropane fatty-acyl-phospholipid synthase-like methyltransferase